MTEQVTPPINNIESPTPTPPPTNKLKLPLIFAAITIIILAGAGMYFAGRQTAKPTVTQISPTNLPSPITDVTANWKNYNNKELGFTLKYPPTWSEKLTEDILADMLMLEGEEGEVSIAWGQGFGGGCDEKYQEDFEIAGETKKICHRKALDLTLKTEVESWGQIYFQRNNKTIAIGARAFGQPNENRELVLKVLSTFKFSNQDSATAVSPTIPFSAPCPSGYIDYGVPLGCVTQEYWENCQKPGSMCPQ